MPDDRRFRWCKCGARIIEVNGRWRAISGPRDCPRWWDKKHRPMR